MTGIQRRRLLLSAFLLSLLAVLALCEWRGWPFLRQPLEQQLSSKLQRDVSFGDGFRLHLLGSIRVSTNHFGIGAAAWEAGAPALLEARDVRLQLPYRSVLGSLRGDGQPLDITLLEAGDVQARLLRDAQGRANWQFGDPSAAGGAFPRFRRLVVHSGHVDVQDALLPLQLQADARTTEGSEEKEPGLHVTAQGRFQDKVFHAEAHSPGALPLIAPEGAGIPVALTLEAELAQNKLHFDGHAKDLLHFGGLNGDFSLKGPSLATLGDAVGATLPTTAAYSSSGRIRKQKSLWTVAVQEFDVGRSHLNGLFHYDTARQRPLLKGELGGSVLALADLAPALGAAPDKTTAVKTENKTGRLLPQREFDIPSLHRMDADVAVNIERVELGSVFALPLQPLQGHLTLDQGELKLEKLLARTADGEVSGLLKLDARQPQQPLWAADVQWSGLKLEKWLKVRNEFARNSERLPSKNPPKTVAPPFVSGQLGGQAKLQGRGRSTADMLASLQGRTQVWIKDGSVSQLLVEGMGLDAAQATGLLIRGDKDIGLRCAAVGLKADKGVLATETGIVDTADSLIVMDGKISLAEEKLDLTLRAKPHDISPLSLRAPLHVRGSFAQPRVRPDGTTVGLKIGAAALLGIVVTPLAALVPLIDPGSSDKGQGCAQTLAELKKIPATPPAMKAALREEKSSTRTR